ncbi:GNAT family N-acetyltransferase [Amycolatopsis taiwanensis]|uniref:GNAT family N-acetyltransferase n=1 Tax=Amycolatopsis taiwanensis TaxID=342230 RepID=UPI0004ADF7B1|nr:GNAT family N-acetyltransferase [Amycolatopsis taiwanensis]
MEIMLRDWLDSDAEWYVQQARDPETLRFTTERESLTVEEFRAALHRLRHDDDALGYVVVDATAGIRLANIAAARKGDVASVSYWVAPAARGQGVAGRALKELCQRVADTWPVTEIRLWTHAENLASQRVAENAGFIACTGDGETKEIKGRQWPVRWYRRGPARTE